MLCHEGHDRWILTPTWGVFLIAMILTVNAGSSSLKITLYQVNPLTVVLSRSVSSFSEFTQSIDPGCPITHICHRIVHGGNYTQPAVIINNQSYHYIQAFSDLAPLSVSFFFFPFFLTLF